MAPDLPWPQWSDLVRIARVLLRPNDLTRKTLENMNVLNGSLDLLSVLDPVVAILNLMQRSDTTLSQVVEWWIELLERVPKNAGGYSLVVERSKQALKCPFFLLANVLDPRYHGRKLNPAQLDLARQFAEEEGAEIASALNLYLTKSVPFRAALFEQKGDPTAWWLAGKMSGFPVCLTNIALRLCGCLSSTANLERIFSTMGHVYGRRRTRLSIEKAGKLTFLFRSLNGGCSADLSDGSDQEE